MDDNAYQPSINDHAVPGKSYQIIPNPGISSSRITGDDCAVEFKDITGALRCTLKAGDHPFMSFHPLCGNDVVTQYTVLNIKSGRLLFTYKMLNTTRRAKRV